MAYYSGALSSTPDTVAVVPTRWNQTSSWASNSSKPISATFPDAVVFAANHLAITAEGELAGLATNGFGTFGCWNYHVKALYTWYGGVVCDAVYDCNHYGAASDVMSPNATATTGSGPGPIDTGAGDRSSKKSDDIALGVGIGIGVPSLIATVLGVWYASRRYNLDFHYGNTATEEQSGDDAAGKI